MPRSSRTLVWPPHGCPLSQADGSWQGVSVVDETTGETSVAVLRKEEEGTLLLWKLPASEEAEAGRFRYTLTTQAPTEAAALEANLLDDEALAPAEGEEPAERKLPRATGAELAVVRGRSALVLGTGEGEPGYTSARMRVEPGRGYRIAFDYLLENAPLHPSYGLSLYVWLYYLDEEGRRTRIPLKEITALHRAAVLTSKETDTGEWKAHQYQVVIPKGVREVELAFHAAAGGKRAVVLSQIRMAPLILSRARDEAMLAQEAAGGHYFDFGPEGSPVFDRASPLATPVRLHRDRTGRRPGDCGDCHRAFGCVG